MSSSRSSQGGDVGRACFMHGGKARSKGPLGRPRRKWKGGIRMDLGDIGWGVWNGFNFLGIRAGGGMLWMLWWTFGLWRHGISESYYLGLAQRVIALQQSRSGLSTRWPRGHTLKQRTNAARVFYFRQRCFRTFSCIFITKDYTRTVLEMFDNSLKLYFQIYRNVLKPDLHIVCRCSWVFVTTVKLCELQPSSENFRPSERQVLFLADNACILESEVGSDIIPVGLLPALWILFVARPNKLEVTCFNFFEN
jgi:hypothetical protein